MKLRLDKSILATNRLLTLTGSKSESNRVLVLQALFSHLTLENLSNSDDTRLMRKALASNNEVIDIHHAGTAMRFLTAYFAFFTKKEVVLTGSSRMKERPIEILVEALRELGASIDYEENEGFPPLRVKPSKLKSNTVKLKANISSQYISALLLSAPRLENGLEIELIGKLTSRPYLEMTLKLLNDIGITTSFEENTIKILSKETVSANNLVVESDWSSASYFFSFIALSDIGTEITLQSFKKDSLQGDAVLVDLYKSFGVESVFHDDKLYLKKVKAMDKAALIDFDLTDAPDIAQTIVVSAFGLGLECKLSGLHTLKIKETDRLVALQNELQKLGAIITITNDSLHLQDSNTINSDIAIQTYNDHRMAMAFAPLALKTVISIEDAMVVSKSYPDFWNDLKILGIQLEEIIN